jgi:hypothetical protein
MKGLKYPCILCLHPFHILVPEQYPSPNNSFNANPTRRRTERLAGARTGGRPTRAARAGLARPARVGGLGRGWLECARAGRGQLKRVRARCGHRECVRGAEETSASDARRARWRQRERPTQEWAWWVGTRRRTCRQRTSSPPQSEHGAADLAEVHNPEYERVRRTSELYVSRTVFTHPAAALGVASLTAGASVRVVVLPEQSPVLQNVCHSKFCS